MEIELKTALVALCGVTIGAVLQYIFTRHIESRRHFREKRAAAYFDLIKGFSQLNFARQTKNIQSENEAIHVLTDAYFRVSIYASDKVLSYLSDFKYFQENGSPNEAKDSMVNCINAMRKEMYLFKRKSVNDEIQKLLFKI